MLLHCKTSFRAKDKENTPYSFTDTTRGHFTYFSLSIYGYYLKNHPLKFIFSGNLERPRRETRFQATALGVASNQKTPASNKRTLDFINLSFVQLTVERECSGYNNSSHITRELP